MSLSLAARTLVHASPLQPHLFLLSFPLLEAGQCHVGRPSEEAPMDVSVNCYQ